MIAQLRGAAQGQMSQRAVDFSGELSARSNRMLRVVMESPPPH